MGALRRPAALFHAKAAVREGVRNRVEEAVVVGRQWHALFSLTRDPCDQPVQAGEVELEGLELELGRGGLELAAIPR